jgi:hypothetical protein
MKSDIAQTVVWVRFDYKAAIVASECCPPLSPTLRGNCNAALDQCVNDDLRLFLFRLARCAITEPALTDTCAAYPGMTMARLTCSLQVLQLRIESR